MRLHDEIAGVECALVMVLSLLLGSAAARFFGGLQVNLQRKSVSLSIDTLPHDVSHDLE